MFAWAELNKMFRILVKMLTTLKDYTLPTCSHFLALLFIFSPIVTLLLGRRGKLLFEENSMDIVNFSLSYIRSGFFVLKFFHFNEVLVSR